MMQFAKCLAFLHHLESFKWKFHLKGIESLLTAIGNPHHRLKFIHVAGSNGKGSTCAMLAQILQESGYKVGLYISPHLKRYNERIQVNGKPISDRAMIRLVTKLKRHHKRQTFFEFFTALAIQHFAEQKVDAVVLEVGLGGRLDATNIVTPLISVISSISLEHTDILGRIIEKIAKEKAGVIKRNVPVVTSAKGEALKIIRTIANARRSRCILIPSSYSGVIGLRGRFQQENAALAAATAKELNTRKLLAISHSEIRKGIATARWPGRLDLRSNVLYDCAHNPDGIHVLTNELRRMRLAHPLVCVFGVLQDKNWNAMLDLLSPQVDCFIFTKPESKRALSPQKLVNTYKPTVPFIIAEDPKAALQQAKRLAKNGTVLVAGSIYLVGQLIPN